MHYVPVLYYILLAFHSQKAFFAAGGLGAAGYEIFVRDDLCLYETALKIAVYDAGGLRGLRIPLNSPCPDLFFADREVGDEAQELIRGGCEPVEP